MRRILKGYITQTDDGQADAIQLISQSLCSTDPVRFSSFERIRFVTTGIYRLRITQITSASFYLRNGRSFRIARRRRRYIYRSKTVRVIFVTLLRLATTGCILRPTNCQVRVLSGAFAILSINGSRYVQDTPAWPITRKETGPIRTPKIVNPSVMPITNQQYRNEAQKYTLTHQ